MKICFVSNFAYSLFSGKNNISFGGAEVQLYNIAKEISKNHDVSIDFVVGDFDQEKIEKYENIRLIRSVKPKTRSSIFEGFVSLIIQFHALIKSDADIYIQRSAGIQTGIVCLYCIVFRKKFVYMTAHEWDCNGYYIKNNGIAGKFYEFGLRNANLVITQTEDHRKILKRNFCIDANVLKSGYKITDKTDNKKNATFILWVARLDRWKQPEVFLELAKKFSGNSFVMIAPKSSDFIYARKIEEQTTRIKNIKFIPGVSLKEVGEYFEKSKIFINTSSAEDFPNTFIQAAISGAPVLLLCVNPEGILESEKIGYYSNGNYEKLERDLSLLLNNHNLYTEISKNAYAYAKKNHNIKNISEDLFFNLKNLISK